jgi:hypothetical protein
MKLQGGALQPQRIQVRYLGGSRSSATGSALEREEPDSVRHIAPGFSVRLVLSMFTAWGLCGP